MMVVLAALAGGIGALARAETTLRLGARRGTAVVNLAGAFLVGLVVGLAEGNLQSSSVYVAGVGFGGGLTTFSTWMLDLVRRDADVQVRAGVVTVLVGMAVAGVAWFVGAAL